MRRRVIFAIALISSIILVGFPPFDSTNGYLLGGTDTTVTDWVYTTATAGMSTVTRTSTVKTPTTQTISTTFTPRTTVTTAVETTTTSFVSCTGLQGDLDLVAFEPMQAVRGVDLVVIKPTVVRATVKSSFKVQVTAHVIINYGNEVVESQEPITPSKSEYYFPSHSYFIMAQAGSVAISVEIKLDGQGITDTNPGNNRKGPNTFNVIETGGLSILFVPLGAAKGEPTPFTREEMEVISNEAIEYVLTAFPIHQTYSSFAWLDTPLLIPDPPPGGSRTSLALDALQEKQSTLRYDVAVGVVKEGWFSFWGWRLIGLGDEPDGYTRPHGTQSIAETSILGQVMVHEIGHTQGLGHPLLDETAKGYWVEKHIPMDGGSLMNRKAGIWLAQSDYVTLFHGFAGKAVSSQSPLSGHIYEGQNVMLTTFVPRDVRSLTATVSYQGSSIQLALADPAGKHYDSTHVSFGQSSVEVRNPSYGNWHISLAGKQLPEEGENFTVKVSLERPSLLESILPYMYWVVPVAVALAVAVAFVYGRTSGRWENVDSRLRRTDGLLCVNCGTKLPPKSKFCNKCGSAQAQPNQ